MQTPIPCLFGRSDTSRGPICKTGDERGDIATLGALCHRNTP
jgi:hypothetical protein